METSTDFKLGLALSGGGFRSSLFHIGVLARMAELDLLRRVDVISSVSGGSIIAAYYYLKVKALLEQSGADGPIEPGPEDYIQLVSEIEIEFLNAVQKNMLLRTYADPGKNARMLADEFSNTERLAELLTNHFYRPILPGRQGADRQYRIPLKDIAIQASGRELSKHTGIPSLIINTTALNTGHLFQFTSSSIGEQPLIQDVEESDVPFLPKFKLHDERLTIDQRKVLYNITLGQAVAASCCVPGIFDPLHIPNLYYSGRKPLSVRLVDGGLVDNQGLTPLFKENCTHIICSDASDILKLEGQPSTQFLNVALRANDILMNRIRNKSLNELYQQYPGRHAVLDLGDPGTRDQVFPEDSGKIVQALTRIRTALDSFSDREAYSLMYYGYHLAEKILGGSGFEFPSAESVLDGKEPWRFLVIRDRFLADETGRKDLLLHLEVGSRQMFRSFMLKKTAPYLIMLPIPVLLGLWLMVGIVRFSPLLFWGLTVCCVLVMIYTQNRKILKFMDNVAILRGLKNRILKTLISLRLPEPFSYLIALASWIQLAVFDRLYLRYGSIGEASSRSQSPTKTHSS